MTKSRKRRLDRRRRPSFPALPDPHFEIEEGRRDDLSTCGLGIFDSGEGGATFLGKETELQPLKMQA